MADCAGAIGYRRMQSAQTAARQRLEQYRIPQYWSPKNDNSYSPINGVSLAQRKNVSFWSISEIIIVDDDDL